MIYLELIPLESRKECVANNGKIDDWNIQDCTTDIFRAPPLRLMSSITGQAYLQSCSCNKLAISVKTMHYEVSKILKHVNCNNCGEYPRPVNDPLQQDMILKTQEPFQNHE